MRITQKKKRKRKDEFKISRYRKTSKRRNKEACFNTAKKKKRRSGFAIHVLAVIVCTRTIFNRTSPTNDARCRVVFARGDLPPDADKVRDAVMTLGSLCLCDNGFFLNFVCRNAA